MMSTSGCKANINGSMGRQHHSGRLVADETFKAFFFKLAFNNSTHELDTMVLQPTKYVWRELKYKVFFNINKNYAS